MIAGDEGVDGIDSQSTSIISTLARRLPTTNMPSAA